MSNRNVKREFQAELPVEAALCELFEATKQLLFRVGDDAPVSELDAAFTRRSEAFDALRQVAEDGPLKTPRAVGLLEEIRDLDAQILEGAQQTASDLRADRSTMTRARHAMTAHTAKERSEPRLVAVRA